MNLNLNSEICRTLIIKSFKMKKIFILCLLFAGIYSANSQSINDNFFTKVNYIGAFDGTNDWTAGWTEWDPVNANYPTPTTTKGNGEFSRATSLHITANETWSGTILLDGWVYVDNGATLTIYPGTIIRGTNKSALIIERGGIIMAEGASNNPIVFTSAQGAGLRANSDWAGLVLNGKAPNNLSGGEGIAEGGIESPYGGTDPNDNSGVLKYIRIEFPGFEVASGKEVNGLTLNSVGDGTIIEYIQVSHSGDDGFEWFGGTVNAKYLVSYKTEDDDFDTDNGFLGMVQFGLIARDSTIVDTDAANAFESDNDESGSTNGPKTNAIFSNISAFGPAASGTSPVVLKPRHAEGAAMRLRRNTRLKIYNSVFAGWSRGVRLESEGSYSSAVNDDSLTVQYSILAGIREVYFKTDVTVGEAGIRTWFNQDKLNNDTLATVEQLGITDPFNYTARNFQPTAESVVHCRSIWASDDCGINSVNENVAGESSVMVYPNPFKGMATFSLSLYEDSSVQISIYNTNGQLVDLIDAGFIYAGNSTVMLDATNYKAGIYFAKVMINDSYEMIKLMVR